MFSVAASADLSDTDSDLHHDDEWSGSDEEDEDDDYTSGDEMSGSEYDHNVHSG
jgi:hypothetical protein